MPQKKAMPTKEKRKLPVDGSRPLFDDHKSIEEGSVENNAQSNGDVAKPLYIFCDGQTYIFWLIDGFITTSYTNGTKVLVDTEINETLIDKIPRMSSAPYVIALKIKSQSNASAQDLLAKNFIPLSDIENVIFPSDKYLNDLRDKWGPLPDVPLDLITLSADKSLFGNFTLNLKEHTPLIEHHQWATNLDRIKNLRLIGLMTTFFWTLDLIFQEGKKGPLFINNLFFTTDTQSSVHEQLFKSICESLQEGSTNDAGFSLLIELIKEIDKIDPSNGFSKKELLGSIDESRFEDKHRETIRQFMFFFEQTESGEKRIPTDWYLNKENKDFIFKAILFFLNHPQAIKISDYRKKSDFMAPNIRILSNTLIGFYSTSTKMLKDIKLDKLDRYKQISDIALLISNGHMIQFDSSVDIVRPNRVSNIKYLGKNILSQILEELEYFNVLTDLENNFGYRISSSSGMNGFLTLAKPNDRKIFTVPTPDENQLIIQFTANAVDTKIITRLLSLTHLRPHIFVSSEKTKGTVTIFIEIPYKDENYPHHRKQFEALVERSNLIM